MTALSYVALSAAAFVILGTGLVACIVSLVRGNRRDVLLTAPIAADQEVRLAYSGIALILVEMPRTADHRALRIQVVNEQNGEIIAMPAAAGEATYGVSTMAVPFGRMRANPGAYRVQIAGLQPGRDYAEWRLVLSRPYMGRMALQIIGIALCGVGMLLSAIWAAWLAGWIRPAQT